MANSQNCFYVCNYYWEKRLIGYSISRENVFSDQPPEKSSRPETILISKKDSVLASCFADFAQSMLGYMEFSFMIAGLSALMSQEFSEQARIRFIETHGRKIEDGENKTVFELPLSTYSEVIQIDKTSSYVRSAGRDVPRMLVVGLTSSFEYNLSQLANSIARIIPDSIFSKEKMISVVDVMKYKTLDEFKKYAVDREVDLMLRGSLDDMIIWFEKKCSLDKIRDDFPRWVQMLELFERRNLFVHANGIINDQYMASATKNRFPNLDKLSIGQELRAGPNYFRDSVILISEFGVKLIQVIWRKLAKEEVSQADEMLNEFSYQLIVRGYYEAAARLLEFGSTVRSHSSDKLRRMMIVNLANAYQLSGEKQKSLKILDAEDWSASSDLFRICVLAVRGDARAAIEIMRQIGPAGSPDRSAYEEWPVFFGVRDDPEFIRCFEEVFGDKFSPASKERATFRKMLMSIRPNAAAVENGSRQEPETTDEAEKEILHQA